MEVNILGTEYDLLEVPKKDDPTLVNNDGYCDTSAKKMIVDEMKEKEPGMKEDLSYYQKQVKRHEIIHAFLFESGLDACCEWVYHVDKLPTVVLLDGEMVHMNRTGAIDVNEVAN